ncbi:hypothetical protein [Antarcticimicrobium luteum]|uniref:Uncharacterized protein n=1 Tax=Antarcticimicrobium luteum TaxID=2547397 RepID=A0A4R5UX31_9RHOB|nr:hypothetical protein [Antarcticimicrobium luteum]TDK43874.1 hypothetical protein E1832_16510 [Antarcticimicrobium luteum]
MKLITPDTISFRAQVTEEELRARMATEVLEQIGGLGPDGKPLPGIKTRVLRGDGRKGGYTIDVTGPAPARLYLPRGEDNG